MSTFVRATAIVLVLAAFATLLFRSSPSRAGGTIITVNTTADAINNDSPNACSLREAVQATRTNAAVFDDCPAGSTDPDKILIGGGPYLLTPGTGDNLGDLDTGGAAAGELVIEGIMPVNVIDGQGMSRIIDAGNTVALRFLTLQNAGVEGVLGGAIFSNGPLFTLQTSVVKDSSGAAGGGVYKTGGQLTVNNTAISGNTATLSGGGGISGDSALVNIYQGTFTGNQAGGSGAAIFALGTSGVNISYSTISGHSSGTGAIASSNDGDASTVSITNSTISGNSITALSVSALDQMNLDYVTLADNSIGILNLGGVNLGKSILANTVNCGGTAPVSQGNNIETANSCGLNSAGDMVGTDPLLGPLEDNGGATEPPTETHRLLGGSPAIDAIASGCPPPSRDQRGESFTRPKDGDSNGGVLCDIGAYEAPAGTTPTPTPSPSPTPSPTPSPAPTPSPTATGGTTPTATPTATGSVTPSATPSPTPTSTVSATPQPSGPTATPTQNPKQGDLDCDNDVDMADFDDSITYAAGLYDGVTPPPECLNIGDPERNSGHPWGDFNCDDAVDALDSLFEIAYLGGVILQQNAGCFPIGQNMT